VSDEFFAATTLVYRTGRPTPEANMKRTIVVALLIGLIGVFFAFTRPGRAVADASSPVPVAKKCGFDSDCPYGKCSGGQCGACGFDSDCKGWGKCSKGQCGSCGFDSDCGSFGPCSSGHCAKSPW
jgi:hypothetical protein